MHHPESDERLPLLRRTFRRCVDHNLVEFRVFGNCRIGYEGSVVILDKVGEFSRKWICLFIFIELLYSMLAGI